jgi:hypothetical protein
VNKIDETKKRTDLERLQRMTSKQEVDTAPVRGRTKKAAKPKVHECTQDLISMSNIA